MYEPHYTYTDALVRNLLKVEQSKTLLQQVDLGYNMRQKLTQALRAKDLVHAAHVLKLEITLRQAEKLMQSIRPEDIEELRFTILKNFKNGLDFNRSMVADTYAEFDRNVVLHINKIMLNQWRETWEANFRSFNDKINDQWDSFVQFADESIAVNDIQREIDGLVEWYKFAVPTVPALVRIAVTMYRLIRIMPFTAGNKFTIAVIIDYLLQKNGYGSKAYSSTMRLFDYNDEKFEKVLEVVHKAKDITYFIDFFIQSMYEELLESREEVNEFIAKEEKDKEQPFLNLNKRQLKILKYLQNVPTIKREDYCHMMEVSTMTAFRDLNDLVRKKLIKIEGKGRGTKYKLSSM